MKILVAAGALALALAPAAFAGTPSNVTVRVEGATDTLLPRTAVNTTTTPVSRGGDPGQTCPGTSGVGALDTATAGNWNGIWQFGSQTVEEILGERHAFDSGASANRYWAFWVNYAFQNLGACETELQEGDDVLWFVDCYGSCEAQKPLRLSVPATAAPGASVEASVTEYSVAFNPNPPYDSSTVATPSQGATVSVDGRSYTTDAQGKTVVALDDRGANGLRATKPDSVPSATETVCVSDGADGFCGNAKPGEPLPPAPACETDGADGRCGTRDGRPPVGRILGIENGDVFKRRRAPRKLRGTVDPDPSGIHSVKIRLKRRRGGDCWGLSKRHDRLIRIRCRRPFFITIGDRAEWSYLLPGRLPKGRYRLDLRVRDKALNVDPLEVGRSRVRFRVR